jgi:transcriptional regulator with XRE-family HTH domain
VQINGPALRTIRELRGMSCSALARAVGTDISFLARVERGEKRGVRMETFERLAWELRISDPRALMVNPFPLSVTHDIGSDRPQSDPAMVLS